MKETVAKQCLRPNNAREALVDLRDYLDELYCAEGTKVAIVITSLDADAYGAAVGLSLIIKKACPNMEVKIVISGYPGDLFNEALLKRFEIPNVVQVINKESFLQETEGWLVALVDSNACCDSRVADGLNMKPGIIIDHHSCEKESCSEVDYVWCDDSAHAASTLFVEMMEALGSGISARVATLLAIGVHNDTASLTHFSGRDYDAYGSACSYGDQKAVHSIITADYPTDHTRHLVAAMQAIDLRNGVCVSYVGEVSPSQRVCIASVADHMVNRPNVTLAIVGGTIGKKLVISIRTKDHPVPISQVIKQYFDGLGGSKNTDASGRCGAGGAELDRPTDNPANTFNWLMYTIHGP